MKQQKRDPLRDLEVPKPPRNRSNKFFQLIRCFVFGALIACGWLLLEINSQDQVCFIEPNGLILGIEIWALGVLCAWQLSEIISYQ